MQAVSAAAISGIDSHAVRAAKVRDEEEFNACLL